MNDQRNPIEIPRAEVDEMAKEWPVIDALLGGTPAMRDAGELFLPKRTLEDPKDYEARLKNATLFPAFEETLKSLVGRAFFEPLQVKEDVPTWIKEEVLDDVDLQGRSLNEFCREWMRCAISYGLSHVIVEAPPRGEVRTAAEQKAAKLRPYLIHVPAKRVIGWREQGGELTQVRVKFTKTEDDGEFGVKVVEQIRVYEPKQVRTFVKRTTNGKVQWIEEDPPVPNELGEVPIVTLYAARTGLMTGVPMLRELAYLNVKHWSQQSSNDALLEVASVPILVAMGMDDDAEIQIGAKSAVKLPVDGKLQFVEHTGAAIKTGHDALASLKDEMREAGAKLLVNPAGSKTATQSSEEAARENSPLGALVVETQDTIGKVLSTVARYRNDENGGTVELVANLEPDAAPLESMRVVMDLNTRGIVSNETTFNEAQRRGIISDEADWEDEQERVANSEPIAPQPGAKPVVGDIDPITGEPKAPATKPPFAK